MCGASKQEKRATEAQASAAESQQAWNEAMMPHAQHFADVARQQQAQQDFWMKSMYEPMLRQYAQTGFAPGERDQIFKQMAEMEGRARRQAEEDVSRTTQQATQGALGQLSAGGYRADAGGGVRPYLQGMLARGGAEERSKALRGIGQQYDQQRLGVDMMGSERRFGTLPMMGQRGQMFNPLGYASATGAFKPGQAQSVQQTPRVFDDILKGVGAATSIWSPGGSWK